MWTAPVLFWVLGSAWCWHFAQGGKCPGLNGYQHLLGVGGADEGRRGLPGIRECPGESWGNLVGAKSPGTVSGCGSSPDPQVVGMRNVSRLPGARGGGGLMSWSGRVMPRETVLAQRAGY